MVARAPLSDTHIKTVLTVTDKRNKIDMYMGKYGKMQLLVIKTKLYILLNANFTKKYGNQCEHYNGNGFDMEPFEALAAILQDPNHEITLGGATPIIKVYQYQNTRILGVYWPSMDQNNIYSNRTLLGSRLFEFEEADYWFLDPNSLKSFSCRRGMNHYIDMFFDIQIDYIDKNGDIEISIIPDKLKEYMKYYELRIKSICKNIPTGINSRLYYLFR